MRRNLLLALGSLVFALLLCEVAIRAMGYAAIYEVYSKPSVFWEHHPIIGWVHTPNARGRYIGPRPWPVEFDTAIEINSLGLRGPETSEIPEPAYRVLVTGDSVVVGFEVPYEETFAALLQDRLTEELGAPVQVINAGVRGYGTDQSLLLYRELGRSLDPDVVVYVHGNNDPTDNITLHRMRRPFGKSAFRLGADGSLELIGVPVPAYPLCTAYRMDSSFEIEAIHTFTSSAICRFQMLVSDHSALFTFVSLALQQSPRLLVLLYESGQPDAHALVDDPGLPREELGRRYDWRVTSALIDRFAREVREDGGRFLLVQYRGWQYLDREKLEPGVDGVFSLEGLFEGRNLRDFIFVRDSHFNTEGHALVAEGLVDPVLEMLEGMPRREAGPQPEAR